MVSSVTPVVFDNSVKLPISLCLGVHCYGVIIALGQMCAGIVHFLWEGGVLRSLHCLNSLRIDNGSYIGIFTRMCVCDDDKD